jgi:hypothetical protein
MWCLAFVPLILAADVRDVEARALADRRAITSAHLQLRVTGYQMIADRRDEYGKTIEVWLDGDRLRVDATSDKKPEAKDDVMGGRRRTMCRNCLKPGHTTTYTHLWGQIETVSNTEDMSGAVGTHQELSDPRQLGFCLLPHGRLRKHGLDYTVGSTDRKDVRLEEGEHAGQKAWVVRATTISGGADLRVWILPTRGHTVGRIEARGEYKGKPWATTLESDLQEYDHVWFPRKYTYREAIHAVHPDKPMAEQTVEVLSAEFNRPIDPKVFTLAGMNAAPGTPVVAANEPMRFWTESGVQRDNPTPPPSAVPPNAQPPEPVQPLPGSGRWWYLVAAVLCAVAAVLFFRRVIVRRS